MPKSAGEDVLLSSWSSAVVLAGLVLAYACSTGKEPLGAGARRAQRQLGIGRFLYAGWGFDRLYDRVLVRPLAWLARVNKNDAIDLPFKGLAGAGRRRQRRPGQDPDRRLRWYAAAVALGAVIVLAVAVFL